MEWRGERRAEARRESGGRAGKGRGRWEVNSRVGCGWWGGSMSHVSWVMAGKGPRNGPQRSGSADSAGARDATRRSRGWVRVVGSRRPLWATSCSLCAPTQGSSEARDCRDAAPPAPALAPAPARPRNVTQRCPVAASLARRALLSPPAGGLALIIQSKAEKEEEEQGGSPPPSCPEMNASRRRQEAVGTLSRRQFHRTRARDKINQTRSTKFWSRLFTKLVDVRRGAFHSFRCGEES